MRGKLGYSYQINLSDLDREAYLRDFNTAVRQALIKAARSFLLAAVPRIPVFTGFARGALGNLEDIAGRVTGNAINTRQQGYKRPQYLQRKKYYYKHRDGRIIVRNTTAGRQFATPSSQIIPEARATLTTNKAVVSFEFAVDILYFNLLDRDRWHAFDAGVDAFEITLREELMRLRPRLGKYRISRKVLDG